MSPSLPSLLGLPSFDTTLGAVLLGLVVGIMLYGITVYQAYKYYTVYADDGIRLKLYITVVLLFETFHSALWTIVCYHYLVTDAFDLLGLIYAEWSLKLTILITGLTVFISQAFYAHRVYYLGHRYYRWLAIPVVVSMVTSLGAPLSLTCLILPKWLISIGYGFAVASDIMLTGALVFVLHRSRTGLKRSDSILDTLIKYTINTGMHHSCPTPYFYQLTVLTPPRIPGLLTSIFSVLAFIFGIILPGNLVYVGVSIVGTKLYANSVLAVVNSRKSIGNKFLDDFTTQDQGSSSQSSADVESMVWNVHQPTTGCATESMSTNRSASFVASAAEAEKPEGREGRQPNLTVTV
ncbi:uncharacterized protein TRAVEDRAFT_53580 [Trametes versicolor FP-101664 SS1]|uniref:uncharacterized protein n=1 Tax=Trametes versicolor (strain FP-101664) TaxID=717944 RepID=UPI0004623BBE|nr:uncharacterized protein TRAVEDRAFT_53580 [Trametes versicolor FP-101664 SS1]EIW52152.1 hypothetical protein TRAVEDRAFT_53580 [Trametes versicolor FP-101664 SS1]